MRRMASPVVRIPLDVSPEMAEAIDRCVGWLQIETSKRQTRTSLIRAAIQLEIDRLEAKNGVESMKDSSPVAPAKMGRRKTG